MVVPNLPDFDLKAFLIVLECLHVLALQIVYTSDMIIRVGHR